MENSKVIVYGFDPVSQATRPMFVNPNGSIGVTVIGQPSVQVANSIAVLQSSTGSTTGPYQPILNIQDTLLYSATTRTGAITTGTRQTYDAHFLRLIIDTKTLTGGKTLTVKIQFWFYDGVTDRFYDKLISPTISAVGQTFLEIGPTLTPVANSVAQDVLPPYINVVVTPSDGTPYICNVFAQWAT